MKNSPNLSLLDLLLSFRRKSDDAAPTAPLAVKNAGRLLIKLDDPAAPGRVTGYGSVFGAVDTYNEVVQPGAFKKSLKRWKSEKAPIPMLWQHYSDEPIGGWEEFEEDDTGLKLAGDIDLDAPKGPGALSAVKKRYVRGLSIGYYEVKADPYDWSNPNPEPRKLYELDLRECSIVTFPANQEARLDAIKARLVRGELPTLREFEAMLQEQCRFTRSQARLVTESGFKSLLQRDAQGGSDGEELKAVKAALGGLRLPEDDWTKSL